MAQITNTVLTKLELDNKQYIEAAKKQEKQQDETNKATEEGEEAVSEMGGALEGMLGSLGLMPGALGKAGAGVKTLSKGFGTLRLAIISTGIGALIIALASLFAWFNRTAEGQNALSRGMAVFGQGIDIILDLFADLGEAIT